MERKTERNIGNNSVLQKSFSHLLNITLILYGIITIVSQIVLMRELVSIFYGNELTMGFMLGAWLFWTAIGSGLLSHWVNRIQNRQRFFIIIQIVWTFIFGLTIFLVRIGMILIGRTSGEITGFLPLLIIPIVSLCPFCLISGFLYILGCSIFSEILKDTTRAIGKTYLLEAIGSALGGVLFSFVLIKCFSPFQIALVLIFSSSLIGLLFYTIHNPFIAKSKRLTIGIVFLLLFCMISFSFFILDSFSIDLLWKDVNVKRIDYSI